MIIKVKKFLIYGIKKEVSEFFKKAQKEGFIEFIGAPRKFKELPSNLKKYISVIKILKKQPILTKKKKLEKIKYNKNIVDKIIQIKSEIDQLEAMKSHLKEEASKANPYGNFSLDELSYIEKETKRIFQFFCIKTSSTKRKVDENLIYITTEYDLDFYISINKEKKNYPKFIEISFEQPIGILKEKILQLEKKIEKEEKNLKSLVIYLEPLKKDLLKQINYYNLEIAKNSSKSNLSDALFSVEAWIPKNKEADIKNLIKKMNVNYEELKISKKEVIPTYLENNKFSQMGEDLIKIYDVPSTSDKDPSIWVLAAFSLFFAMIISDAGYGFLYLLIALVLKIKIKTPKPAFKRFINLIFLLSFSCIFWGIITCSFFGIEINPKSPLQKVSLLNYLSKKKAEYHLTVKDDVYEKWFKKYPLVKNAKNGMQFLLKTESTKDRKKVYEALNEFNSNILLEFSLLIGIFHIAVSFIRNVKRNFAGIGWIIFMIGGYLFFPKILNATTIFNFANISSKEITFKIGKILVFSGGSLALLLSLFQNKLKGIKEITKVIGVFGDVLSYLRLYALAVAGMILSQTFNDIAGYSGIFAGIFIITIGHLINIILGIIGGVIHGLRLNFLEWYNHCFQGGGKLFNPLKLIK